MGSNKQAPPLPPLPQGNQLTNPVVHRYNTWVSDGPMLLTAAMQERQRLQTEISRLQKHVGELTKIIEDHDKL
tara:strand:+ start:358 stop:576 length:219 start_codon:yes stop_codon:yes gene_type:complete